MALAILRDVRIARIHDWQWDENECVVSFDGDDAVERWTAPLPPFASPCALYAAVRADAGRRTVLDWVHEPPTWSPVNIDLPEKAMEAARTALRLPGDAPRERVAEAAQKRDVQIVAAMGAWRGSFDGAALSEETRTRLALNWSAFGRHEARCTAAPHTVVLPTDADPLHAQHAHFDRSNVPELRRLSAAATAWRAVRRARLGRATLSIVETFGQEAYDILVEQGLVAAAASPSRGLPAAHRSTTAAHLEGRPRLVFEGASVNLCFSHAPGAAPVDAVHWFASCIAVACSHPRRRFFGADAVPKLGAYAVHEQHGAVYVVSAAGNVAVASDGRALTRGGLAFTALPTAAEGGCDLFAPRSASHVGVFCPRGDGSTWSSALVRRVLSLLAPGGHVHTNCVSTSFLTEM
jgi:hypothetical protein